MHTYIITYLLYPLLPAESSNQLQQKIFRGTLGGFIVWLNKDEQQIIFTCAKAEEKKQGEVKILAIRNDSHIDAPAAKEAEYFFRPIVVVG